MSRRIGEPDSIIQRIAVPIQALRIPRLRHDRIRTDEPPDDRIIPSGVVEQQTAAAVLALTGEVVAGRRRASDVTPSAPGVIAQLGVGVEPRAGASQRQRL